MRESIAVVRVEAAEDVKDEATRFPPDVRQCMRGPGTGSAAAEDERCGWLGVSRDSSLVMRQAVVGKDQMAPKDMAAALSGVRSSRVLHFDSMVPLMKHNTGHRGWETGYQASASLVVPDAWCCSKAGHRFYTAK